MSERIAHGLARTPSGRVREMTDREIDAFADAMDRFAEVYAEALNHLPSDPRGEAYRHGAALVIAEGA